MDSRDIWERLIEVAFDDGRLTDDEQKILKSGLDNLDRYCEILEHALEDDIIDHEEMIKFYELRIAIMKNVNEVAIADNQITGDEYELIVATHEILNELENHMNCTVMAAKETVKT